MKERKTWCGRHGVVVYTAFLRACLLRCVTLHTEKRSGESQLAGEINKEEKKKMKSGGNQNINEINGEKSENRKWHQWRNGVSINGEKAEKSIMKHHQ